MEFEKQTRRFNKDIQIQIDKPKYKEPFIKSKARHIDGGGRTPLDHMN